MVCCGISGFTLKSSAAKSIGWKSRNSEWKINCNAYSARCTRTICSEWRKRRCRDSERPEKSARAVAKWELSEMGWGHRLERRCVIPARSVSPTAQQSKCGALAANVVFGTLLWTTHICIRRKPFRALWPSYFNQNCQKRFARSISREVYSRHSIRWRCLHHNLPNAAFPLPRPRWLIVGSDVFCMSAPTFETIGIAQVGQRLQQQQQQHKKKNAPGVSDSRCLCRAWGFRPYWARWRSKQTGICEIGALT